MENSDNSDKNYINSGHRKKNKDNYSLKEKEENIESNKQYKKTENKKEKKLINKSPDQNNTELHQKLKKILTTHDKRRLDYSKKEIQEFLKYQSSDSESSEHSGIKKIKKSKNDKNYRNSVKAENTNLNYNKIKSNQKSHIKNKEFIKSKSRKKKKNSEEDNSSPKIKNKEESNISNIEISGNDKKAKKKAKTNKNRQLNEDENKKPMLKTILEKIKEKRNTIQQRDSRKLDIKETEAMKNNKKLNSPSKSNEKEEMPNYKSSEKKKKTEERKSTHDHKNENIILPTKIYKEEEGVDTNKKTSKIITANYKIKDVEIIKKLMENSQKEVKSKEKKENETQNNSPSKKLNIQNKNILYDKKKSLDTCNSGNIYRPKKAGNGTAVRKGSLERNISNNINNTNKNPDNTFSTVTNNNPAGTYIKKRSPIREKKKTIQLNRSFCGCENDNIKNTNIFASNNFVHSKNNISSLDNNPTNKLNSSFDFSAKKYADNNSNFLTNHPNIFNNSIMNNYYESVKYMNNLNNNSFYELKPQNIMTFDANNSFSVDYSNRLTNYSTQTFNVLNSNNYFGNDIQRNIPQYNNITPNSIIPNSMYASTSINIEDLLVLEEKLNEILITLNKTKIVYNDCFEFWNYFYNCSLYVFLDKLFTNVYDSSNVKNSVNFLLMSIMICYEFSFDINCLNSAFPILDDLLKLNHTNLMLIYEHILTKISTESRDNIWVFKLRYLVNLTKNYQNYSYNALPIVEKISFNTRIILQNLRVLLKNFRTNNINHLINIFKRLNTLSYEDINKFFREYVFHVENMNGSVLASIFLKKNTNFKSEPAPYLKTENPKPFSLVLDLDETLVHFKVNPKNENEGVLRVRPGITEFLDSIDKYYELIIFTAATQDYADLLIDAVEENKIYFEHRLYRQHTVIIDNDFVKDLTRIGRPLDKIAIVDNMPQNFRLQKENGINIKAFWGEEIYDTALIDLAPILVNIAKEGGDIRVGLAKYKDEIIKKVTSNISKNIQ